MTNPSSQDLQEALDKAKQSQKKLHVILWVSAVFFALFISAFAANHNLYSLLMTFMMAFICLTLAGIYRVSLLVLYVLILIYSITDNYISHDYSYHQQHFLIQFAALLIFTTIFSQGTPYLMRALTENNGTK
jgi:K+-sensing histidine kinase KdpD